MQSVLLKWTFFCILAHFPMPSLKFEKKIPYFQFCFVHIGYGQCYICGATAAQMSEPQGILHWFLPKPGTLMLGIHPLHIEMQGWNWFNKNAFHQDFRKWACEGIEYHINYLMPNQSFTYLMLNLRRDINRISSFSSHRR